MKILQINCHYNYGSTGKIMYDIDRYLENHHIESFQCYARGKKVKRERVLKIAYEPICKIGKAFNLFYGRPLLWGTYSLKKVVRIIEKARPDVVHIHCINAYTVNVYGLLNYLKKKGIGTVITLHAEFMYTGGCSYAYNCDKWKEKEGCRSCKVKNANKNWNSMKEAFSGFNREKLALVSVSPWLRDRALNSTILENYYHKIVMNGIDTYTFRKRTRDEIEKVKKKYGICLDRILLHVTSDFDAPVKGGRYVRQIAHMMEEDNLSDVEIIVVGPVKKRENTKNIKFVGVVTNQADLAALYSMSSITLLTSKRETFSMICAESLCCGTPVIGFKAGAPETISIPEYSSFFKFGDINSMYKAVKKTLYSSQSDRAVIIEKAHKTYSAETMAQNYISIYRNVAYV